jgi:hypothetical protein
MVDPFGKAARQAGGSALLYLWIKAVFRMKTSIYLAGMPVTVLSFYFLIRSKTHLLTPGATFPVRL